ncbi:MAG TPA: hypothetical protein VGK73_18990 [Polyangiaceae bacterium]
MNQFKTTLPGVLAVLSLSGALACGDDGGSNGSGVSGSKALSDVTASEAEKVCEWIEEQASSIQPSKKQLCTALAISLTTDEQSCDALVDECVKADPIDPEPGEEEEEDACADADELVTSCETVTVSEFETCMKAYVDAVEREIASASCARAGEELDFDAQPPPACRKIEQECPELLAGIGDEEEAG